MTRPLTALAVIETVAVAAAHDGEAELVVTLRHENGGRSRVTLDEPAARHLFAATGAGDPESLVGQGWEHVRDALLASSARHQSLQA
ncbi:hypothetical protein [Thermaurantiacus sp.]